VSMFLALPVHASDSKGNEVDAAWAKFVASPSGANAEAAARLLDDGQRLTSSVEDLSILDSEVQAGKSEAIHLAFAINAAYGAHFAEEAGVVAGHGIRSNPQAFLKFLDLYRGKIPSVRAVCANFGEAFVDQPEKHAAEAKARVAILSKAKGESPKEPYFECLRSLQDLEGPETSH